MVKANLNQYKSAFTLIEVIITLFLLTTVMGLMVGVQVRAYNRLTQDRQSLEKLFLLKRAYVDAVAYIDPEHIELVKKEYEAYDFKARTTFYDIPKQSVLKPFAKNVRMVVTDASWQVRNLFKEHGQLVSFVCVPGIKEAKQK